MNPIDLRSDTVTKPTQGMLDAMINAHVGDDVFGEDPTVNALEKQAATLFGKEKSLYCPSGTMTNQIAIRCLVGAGDEVICDKTAHIYNYEGGGIAANAGASVRLIDGKRGIITGEQVLENINPDDSHYPKTRLVCLENTSNKGGGSYYTSKEINSISKVCRANGLLLHLDGARIFNALAATGETPLSIGSYFDTISVCLSKGLGAPMGSLLIGDAKVMAKAKRMRKMMGGGMRQVGYMAAAGIYALDNHIDRLKEDHKRAKDLADGIKSFSFVEFIEPVVTNIVLIKLTASVERDSLINQLRENGVLVVPLGPQVIRMVTHLELDDKMVEKTIEVMQSI
jgi:threonine aldolase